MTGFTRLALVVLTGMTGRILRRSRKKTDRAAAANASGTSSPAKPSQVGSAQETPQSVPEAAIAAPVDPFRQLSAQRRTPRVASVAARSLPALGLLGLVVTLVLAIGAVRGELPYVGVLEDANLAWASVLVSISIWAVYLLWKVPQWQAAAWARSGSSNPRELFQIENESRGTLGQILSGVAVLTGLIFAWQQLGQTSDNLRVSEEGQITDRFSRAVDQLGSDQFTIRLGGIYALERIARDSPRDYEPVMEVLTAFARQQSPLPRAGAGTPLAAVSGEIPLDVLAVFKVIGRRTPAQIETELEEGGCLDLTGISAVGANLADYDLRNTCWDRSDLRGAIVARADLSQATFVGANLQQANLDSVVAVGADFNNANLTFANLSKADLNDANLLAANLGTATLQDTELAGANLVSADLTGALAFGADFAGANMLDTNLAATLLTDAKLATAQQLTQDQVAAALTNSATTLPEGINVPPDL
jgi:uncharacterized protein YjbI with pentapeptide repeats